MFTKATLAEAKAASKAKATNPSKAASCSRGADQYSNPF
jgi:hypothetical protein